MYLFCLAGERGQSKDIVGEHRQMEVRKDTHMNARRLFERLRRRLRGELDASGAEFGAVEIRHGMMQQESTLIIYTDLTSPMFHFVPELIARIDGTIDFTIGTDQIWIRADRPIRWTAEKLTSLKRDPLKVKVDVYERGEDQYDINLLLPLAMNVARLGVVVDTDSLYRARERDLPAMSMMGPLFEGLQPESSPADSIEAMMMDFVDSLRAKLGPGCRVEATMKQSPRKGGLGSLFGHFLGGRKAKEEWQLPPGVHRDGDHFVIEAVSMEEAIQTYRQMYATKPAGMELLPALVVEKAAGASSPSASGSYQIPVPDDATLVRLWQTASDEEYQRLLRGDCDVCHKRSKCPAEAYTRASQRVLGVTPRSHRHGGVTSDDLWSAIDAMGAEFGHPSFTRSHGHEQEDPCVDCRTRSMCQNYLGRRKEAEEATVCRTCSVQDVCYRNPSQVHLCWEAIQANQSQPVAEPAAETADAGEQPAEDAVVATQTASDTVADPAEQSVHDQASVTDESAATGVAEAQAQTSPSGDSASS